MKRLGSVFYGWWVVAACFALSAYVGGVYFFGFSVFFDPLQSEFGWSRAATALAFSFASIETAFAGPVLGPLVDRFGGRRVMLFGVVAVGLGFVNLGLIDSLAAFYLAYFLLAIGASSVNGVAPMAVVARWFQRRRTVALGMLTSGFSVGGGIMVPLLGLLIANLDWRPTTKLVALGMWALGFPLLLVVRNRPEPYGYGPDGDPLLDPIAIDTNLGETVSSQPSRPVETSFSLKGALTSTTWWLLSLAFAVRAISLSSVVAHLVPLLTDRGFDHQAASNLVGVVAFMGMPGRLLFGFLGDLYSKRALLVLTFSLQAIALAILMFATDILHVYIFALIFGLAWGTVPLFFGILAEYFGPASFASIVGFSQAVQQIGTATGPVFAGWVFDSTGSYNLALAIYIATMGLGICGILLARRPVAATSPIAARLRT